MFSPVAPEKMPLACRLPDCFERVVLVGGLCPSGVIAAAGLALSPFLQPHQEIILTNTIVAADGGNGNNGTTALLQECEAAAAATLEAVRVEVARSRTDIGGDAVHPSLLQQSHAIPLQCFLGSQHPSTAREAAERLGRVKLHNSGAATTTTTTVRRGKDVMMCVLNSGEEGAERGVSIESIVGQIQRVVAVHHSNSPSGGGGGGGGGIDGCGCVIAITDDRSRFALAPLIQAMSGGTATGRSSSSNYKNSTRCFLVVGRCRELSPPALEYALTRVALTTTTTTTAAGKSGSGGVKGLLSVAPMMGSMLPLLCTGMAMGVVTELPVYRHAKAPFAPVDVAINAAVCQAIAVMQQQQQNALSAAAVVANRSWHHSVVAVDGQASDEALVWGMVGEYLIDYLGRYHRQIRAAFPVEGRRLLLPPTGRGSGGGPALNFLFSAWDVGNYGPDTADVFRVRDSRGAAAQRRRIAAAVPPAWGLGPFLARVDAAINRTISVSSGSGGGGRIASRTCDNKTKDDTGLPAHLRSTVPGLAATTTSAAAVAKPPPASPDNESVLLAQLLAPLSNNSSSSGGGGAIAAYAALVASLLADTRTVPLAQYISLAVVDWGMYVRYTARLVLEALATCAVAIETRTTAAPPPQVSKTENIKWPFPFPSRIFANDIIFADALRAPPPLSMIRRNLGAADWIYRTGLNANGFRGKMTPGWTPARAAALLSQPDMQRVMDTVVRTGNGGGGGGGKMTAGNSSKEEVMKRARKMLLRIGDTLNHLQCRTMGAIIAQLFHRVYDRMRLNPGAFEQLRRINALPRTTIVYIPLHRSYTDFLVMSYLLAVMGLQPPHIVAGEDFLRLGKFSELMRGSGAFFMRRIFRGDPLYAAVFKAYVGQMVRSGLPLEFFIEGTRSRTGKTMVPKMGILKFITDAFLACEGTASNVAGEEGLAPLEDVLFVPVSLSYDELLEGRVYADELLGIPKPKESVGNMLKAATQLKHKYGDVNMHFGDPISLRAVRKNPLECPVPFQPKEAGSSSSSGGGGVILQQQQHMATTTAGAAVVESPPSSKRTPALLLTSLAWRITYELQRNIVITAPSLVAAAIETLTPQCQEAGKDHLPLSGVVATAVWIAAAVEARGGRLLPSLSTTHVTHGGNEAVDWECVVATAMGSLGRFVKIDRPTGITSGSEGKRGGSGSGPRPSPAVRYDPPTITSQLGVHINTNQLIHVFIDEALVAVAAHAYGEAIHSSGAVIGRTIRSDALVAATTFLRTVLASEFPNFAPFTPCSDASWLRYALDRLTIGAEEQRIAAVCRQQYNSNTSSSLSSPVMVFVPATRLYQFLLQLLLPHIEALYMVAITALACFETAGPPQSTTGRVVGQQPIVIVKYAVIAAHKAAQQLYRKRLIDYIVGCNKETVTHYFQSLADLQLIRTQAVDDRGMAYALLPTTPASLAFLTGSHKQQQQQPRQQQQQQQLAGLGALVGRLQLMRWHPSADPVEEVNIAKRTVLTCYDALTRGAKL